jgi:hypothetical protein
MQAAWQALHPMQRETSISLATSIALRTPGGVKVVADRRVISRDCRGMAPSYAFWTSTRNALYSGVWMLASPTDGVRVFTR